MKILSAKEFGIKLKATIQATGRLGFPKLTSDALKFNARQYVKFAQSEDNNNDLFMCVLSEPNEDAFKVICSGGYYSLGTKVLFDIVGYDYLNYTIIFDLNRASHLDEELQGEVYKMCERKLSKNNKKETDNMEES